MKVLNLFDAYVQGALPSDEGYIISSFLKESGAYSVYELVAYSSVKDMFGTEDSITFRASARKIYLLAEPPTYPSKMVEPCRRPQEDMVPFRFTEAFHMTAKNRANIYFSKEPCQAISAFTVFRPEGINFSYIFYPGSDVFEAIEGFLAHSLHSDARLPRSDASRAARRVAKLCAQKLAPSLGGGD